MQQATTSTGRPRGRAAIALVAIALARAAAAGPAVHDPAAVEFFENRIRPVLVEHCYGCHSAAEASPKGELRLDTAADVLKGGASGSVITPGKPDESALLEALRYESYEMPPAGKLPDAVIADFETWIAMGAPDPRADEGPDASGADAAAFQDPREIWSLRRPVKLTPPAVKHVDRVRTEVDGFVLSKLEEAGLEPSPEADPRTILRRLSYLLTGLAPSAEELDAFAAKASDAEYEQAVDRLLASPRFGERWGRHWLDIARYADTKGYVFVEDRNYPHAYKFRDWVIAAFNGDMAFDRFVISQLAADQTEDPDDAAAMGFLTLGRRFLNNPVDINDDRIDLISRGLMGMTVACARCHDHKFDAIPTADYYSLYGVLASSDESPQTEGPSLLVDKPTPVEPVIFIRGNSGNHGPQVSRHFLTCLAAGEPAPFQKGSGRLELAEAIASRDNPLTARVWVNRVWAQLFGRGLVTTTSDFGIRGEAPTHPELLDWLATTFMEEGWSTKRLVRQLVLSSAFRQASAPRPDSEMVDPNNALLVRMNRRRLDLEGMRDGLLAAAGRLDETMGGPAVQLTEAPFATRRAVYGFIERQNLPAFFRTFDFANPNTPSASRPQTASPHQALFMLNSPFAIEQACKLAERGAASSGDGERIAAMYRFALGRGPSDEELAEATAFVAAGVQGDADAVAATVAPPRWQYGWGAYDPLSDRVEFQPLPHFAASNSWQGSESLPDAALGWAMLNADGGHPGDQTHQVIRRFTAPASGVLHVEGRLKHEPLEGDGVRGRVVSSSRGKLGEWVSAHEKVDVAVDGIEVAANETIDFVVDCQESVDFDSFTWRTTVRLECTDGGEERWNSREGFAGPQPPPLVLDRWGQLAQVLLMSNEFMFVD